MAIPAALRRARAIARRDGLFLGAGLPLHLVAVVLWIWLARLVLTAPAITFVPLLVMVGVSPALTGAQRRRYRTVTGVRLPRSAAASGRPGPRRLLAWLRSPDTWRQIGYHAVAASRRRRGAARARRVGSGNRGGHHLPVGVGTASRVAVQPGRLYISGGLHHGRRSGRPGHCGVAHLALMAEGRSNAGIARALVVSDGTIAKHINNIFAKLDLPAADGDHRRVLAVLRYLGTPPE